MSVEIQNKVSLPIKIEKGIKMPFSSKVATPTKKYNNYKKIFNKMQTGDSFIVEQTKLSGISQASKKLNFNYISRSINDQVVRVWKV